MTARSGFGIVILPVADVRRQPRHQAELRNQLLIGECVRLQGSASRGQWLRVESLEDGYSGWVRSWGLLPVSRSRVMSWQRLARARVGALMARLRGRRGEDLGPVFLGSRLRLRSRAAGRASVELPDGRVGFVPASALLEPGRRPEPLGTRVRVMMGVPYLWGGRTPAGLDCSGFTQLLFAERGTRLPRDARDQFRATRRLMASERLRQGDLVFFAAPRQPVSHVGVLLRNGTFVHARGTVRLGSLDPRSPLCDKELLAQLRGFGRP